MNRDDEAPTSGGPIRSDSSLFRAERIEAWGHFRDLRFLAEGGMGRIYQGRDDTLQRRVALKLLRKDDPQLSARFLQEAALQARVEHPNVCRVYEAGEWGGQAFIAMQLIQGQTLSVLAKELSLGEKLQVMVQVCEGVHAAHQEGLVHRDLKPSNLMVERGEGGLHAYVLDFGLARVGTAPGLTESGMVMGTVHYMSPEQARGAEGGLDRRSDVYALGVCLYELFAGDVPFGDLKGLEVLTATLDRDPPTLRHRAEVPVDLDTVVMKCLEKSPARRYDTARALGDELHRVLVGDPILARRITARERAARWVRKNRLLVAVGALGLALALAASGLAVRERVRAGRRAAFAQAFGQEAERIEALARYAHLAPMHDLAREGEALRARVRRLESAVTAGGSVAEAPGAYALGRARLAMGELVEARSHLERAEALGFQSGDLSAALGRTLGALYLRESDQAYGIPSLDLRQAHLKALDRDLLQPALRHLRAGQGSTLEPAEYVEALIALYAGRPEEALARAAAASAAAPWFYEAQRLMGEIHLQQAHHASDPAIQERHLVAADQAFRSAQSLAPSDPALRLGQARRWRDQMGLETERGASSQRAYEALKAACEEARILRPGDPEAKVLLAWGQVAWGVNLQLFRRDGLARFQAALADLEDPSLASNAEACYVRAWAHERLARLRFETGQDQLAELALASAALDRALALDPKHLRAFDKRHSLESIRFQALMQLGQSPAPALEAMKALAQEAPGRGVPEDLAQSQLGYAWYHQGDYEMHHGSDPRASLQASEAAFRKALTLNPASALHFDGLANTLWDLGDFEALAGRDPEPRYQEALALLEQGTSRNGLLPNLQTSLVELNLQWARTRLDAGQEASEPLRAAARWIEGGPTRSWAFAYFRGLLHACQAAQAARQGGAWQAEVEEARRNLDRAQVMSPGAFQPAVARADLALWLHQAGVPQARLYREALAGLERGLRHATLPAYFRFAEARLGIQGGTRWAGPQGDPAAVQRALDEALQGNANLAGAIQRWRALSSRGSLYRSPSS